MAFTPIPKGTPNWDVPVNDAFTAQDSRITDTEDVNDQQWFEITQNRDGLAAISDWQPADNQILSWTIDPALASGSVATTSGAVALGQIVVKVNAVVNTLYAGLTASTTTATAGYMGIYDAAGTLLGQTANQAATWNGTTGPMAVPLTAPVSLTPGKYYIALLINAAATGTWLRGAGGGSNWANLPIAGAQRFGNTGAGLSALPASFSPGAVSASNNSFTFGVA